MTINEAIKLVEEGIRLNGLNIHKINRLEIIEAARQVVKAQGDDPTSTPGEVVAFKRR